MGLLSFFRTATDDTSAKLAKDRLQVLIAHERSDRNGPDYLPQLRQDILEVIKKYVKVGDESLTVQLETQDDCDILELNITLPENDRRKAIEPSDEAKRRAAERRRLQMEGRVT